MKELFEALEELMGKGKKTEAVESKKSSANNINDAVLAALGLNNNTLTMMYQIMELIPVDATKIVKLKLEMTKEATKKAAEMFIYENKKNLDKELVRRIIKDMELDND